MTRVCLWKPQYQMNRWKRHFANGNDGHLSYYFSLAGKMLSACLTLWKKFETRTMFTEFCLLNKMSLSLSQTLAGMSEYCSPLLEGCQKNRQHWKRLAEECEKGLVNGLVWCHTILVFNQHIFPGFALCNQVSQNFIKLAWHARTNNTLYARKVAKKLIFLSGKDYVLGKNTGFGLTATGQIHLPSTFATLK